MNNVWEVTFTTRHDIEKAVEEIDVSDMRSALLNQGGPLFSTPEQARHCVGEALAVAKKVHDDAFDNPKRVVEHDNTIAIMWFDEEGNPVYYACIHKREIDCEPQPEGRMQ